MKLNGAMKMLLARHKIDDIHLIPQDNTYPIWQKEDMVGRKYWGVSNFWGIDQHPIESTQDLSQLEWDGNEIWLDAQTDEAVKAILIKAVGILQYWKYVLESTFQETPFYIFASYDDGDMQILEKDELPTRSVTLRFWADRGTDTVIYLDNFDAWDQPAIVGYCNSAPLS
jgi:hypothetical protein